MEWSGWEKYPLSNKTTGVFKVGAFLELNGVHMEAWLLI